MIAASANIVKKNHLMRPRFIKPSAMSDDRLTLRADL